MKAKEIIYVIENVQTWYIMNSNNNNNNNNNNIKKKRKNIHNIIEKQH
jgi:hypothetical protein